MDLDISNCTNKSLGALTHQGLEKLKLQMMNHPIWTNPLLKAAELGHFKVEDYKFIFEQYYAYSKNFTRYLCALMANLEDDFYRSKLSENIWEEGGGADPDERHSEIFRKFLREALNININEIQFNDSALRFTGDYLNYCISKPALEVSSFLSLGTEAIISRLYQVFIDGMVKAGIESSKLHFFHLHVACDDEHAETLENILLSFQNEPNWLERAEVGLLTALGLRDQFFHSLYEAIIQRRAKEKLQKINSRKSLLRDEVSNSDLFFRPLDKNEATLYENKLEKHNIDFTVTRAPYPAEVLDARVVRIAPLKNNERHTHAHESIFYILEGEGVVQVGQREIPVKTGDSVFVPRWAIHQTRNTKENEMVILALTDFYLTGDVFIGNYNSTARMKKTEKNLETP